jgi:lipopolysaccharide biosynthesis glycosyltransferase
MILNRVNLDSEHTKIKINEARKKEHTEEEEVEEEEEENESEDDHKKKGLRSKGIESIKRSIKTLIDKILYYKIFSISLAAIIILIILLILIFKRSKRGKTELLSIFEKGKYKDDNRTISDNENKQNEEQQPMNKEEEEKKNKINDELINAYNTIGEINIIKYFEETINQRSYSIPDTSQFTNIHFNIGFNEKNIDTTIKHIASILYRSKENSFLHLHMMDADTFTCESLLKLKNMIYKINNKTEIIIYNAAQALKDFKIKDGATEKFSKEYAKLYAFKIIKNVQKIIFLDGDDCMVQKDLSELYNLDMNDIYVRGISEDPSIKNPSDWLDKYLPDKSHYINGGVLLVNIELCQKEDFYNKAIQLNNEEFYTKTEDPAQDILNVLMRKKIEFFHPKYNKINFYENNEDKNDENKWYPWVSQTLKLSEKNNHFYSKEELMEADNDPVIIHYAWDAQLNKVIKKYEEDKNTFATLVGIS